MWLVLCHDRDVVAAWCAVAMRHSGLSPVEVVLAQDLAFGASLKHSVIDGRAHTEIRLGDGRVLVSDDIRGVINRLVAMPPGEDVPEADKPYAVAERTAATVSWLAGLTCPVVNPPTANFLSGRWRRDPEWQQLAAYVGLPTAGWYSAAPAQEIARHGVLVAGTEVLGAPEDGLDGRLARLAAVAETPLCEVFFAATDNGWAVDGATTLANVRAYGEPGAAALVRLLTGERT